MKTEEPSSRTNSHLPLPTDPSLVKLFSLKATTSLVKDPILHSSSSQTSMEVLGLRINTDLSYLEIYQSLGLNPPEPSGAAFCLAKVLERMVSANADRTPSKSIFHSKKIPGISIEKYLQRQAAYSRCSSECFFLALIYLDRYFEKVPDQCLVPKNVHKLFFISLVTAVKFQDDLKLSNADFAKLGGLDKYDLCLLEMQFLRSIAFNVNVSSTEFVSYVKSVTEFME